MRAHHRCEGHGESRYTCARASAFRRSLGGSATRVQHCCLEAHLALCMVCCQSGAPMLTRVSARAAQLRALSARRPVDVTGLIDDGVAQ